VPTASTSAATPGRAQLTNEVEKALRRRLDARPLASASAFIDHYRCFWEGSLEQLARYLEDE
jgi:hypothetical protein